MLKNEENRGRIAIVVVGYNRLDSISRLLSSLLLADYHNSNVPLIISIDCSGNQELYNYCLLYTSPSPRDS